MTQNSKTSGGKDVSRETSEASGAAEAAAEVAEKSEIMPRGTEGSPLAAELADENRRRKKLHELDMKRPEQTRIITVSNQKGGVGKTTSTVNLSAALAKHGFEVLVIDIDPQGNASTGLGVAHSSDVDSIYEVLVDDYSIADVVQKSADIDGLNVVPATIDLAGAEIELVSLVAREQRLQRAVRSYQEYRQEQGFQRLDYVFIDCPPSLGLLTVNAFVAAAEVLIPIQCEYYALEGLSQLMNNIGLIQKHLNPPLRVSTILLTMYDARTKLASQVSDEVREHFPEATLNTRIPRNVRISEAPSYQQSVITYDPHSTGALSYLEAAAEIVQRER